MNLFQAFAFKWVNSYRRYARDRLVKIFDLDNGGSIGFREFIYGLSKFQIDTFER